MDDEMERFLRENAKVEPSSDVRQLAAVYYETYQAFKDAGFDEGAAMILLLKQIEVAAQ